MRTLYQAAVDALEDVELAAFVFPKRGVPSSPIIDNLEDLASRAIAAAAACRLARDLGRPEAS